MKLKKDDHLKLVGLLALATQHKKALDDIGRAICDIVKVEKWEDGGHVTDAIYAGYSADELLRELDAAEANKKKKAKIAR